MNGTTYGGQGYGGLYGVSTSPAAPVVTPPVGRVFKIASTILRAAPQAGNLRPFSKPRLR